jgi:hypothetical protein
MVLITQDKMVYDYSNSADSEEVPEKPFLTKEMLYIRDNNGSDDYSNNQVTFNGTSLSNNGKWCDYKNAYFSIPLVGIITCDKDLSDNDVKIAMKSGNENMINSMTVKYNNEIVVQGNPDLNAYTVFKKHTTKSLDDVNVNSHTGYRKDKSETWSYSEAKGVHNNSSTNLVKSESPFVLHDVNKDLVLSNSELYQKNVNTYVIQASKKIHYYYYDCVIPLRDLPFFESLPMIRGSMIEITLNLNQFDILLTTGVAASPLVTVANKTLLGDTVPVMIVGDLPVESVTTLSMRVASNYDHVTNSSVKHPSRKECRLYVPVYTMEQEIYQPQYLAWGTKKVVYEDYYLKQIKDVSQGDFNYVLTNAASRMKRLLIIPMLSESSNGNANFKLTPRTSPFSTEPSTTSPYYIDKYNVKLSANNVYPEDLNLDYNHYLNELNGNYALNANMETGSTSSLISMIDYNSIYGYILTDLSRRNKIDDNMPLSVEIRGRLNSPKTLDFLCYIIYEKDITIDIVTGAIIKN